MLHVSRRKSFCTQQVTPESQTQYSEDSLGFFLKLPLHNLKKLFVHFKVKILGMGPTTRAFIFLVQVAEEEKERLIKKPNQAKQTRTTTKTNSLV